MVELSANVFYRPAGHLATHFQVELSPYVSFDRGHTCTHNLVILSAKYSYGHPEYPLN